MQYTIREMAIEDYPQVYELWTHMKGFGIRSIDDSKEGIVRFLKRNPTTSMVAVTDGKIVGAVLCGHDGRRGCFYHVCVDAKYRKHGIGKAMTEAAVQALRAEGINTVCLIAFTDNSIGNQFWQSMGWKWRQDLNYYDFIVNADNSITFQ